MKFSLRPSSSRPVSAELYRSVASSGAASRTGGFASSGSGSGVGDRGQFARFAPFFALALGLVFASSAAAQESAGAKSAWERVKNDEGILVERRAVEGSAMQEFQGAGVVKAPIDLVFAVVRDADRRVEWMADCAESIGLEEFPDTNQISYNRTKTPWPVEDRDVVLEGKVFPDLKKKLIYLPFSETTHPKAPEKSGVTRMSFLRGHWRLTALGPAETKVEYRVHANPGGSLPKGLANRASQSLPFDTLKNLRKQVVAAAGDYQQARARFARDYPGFVGGKSAAVETDVKTPSAAGEAEGDEADKKAGESEE